MTNNINDIIFNKNTIHLGGVDSIRALSEFFPTCVNNQNQAFFPDLEGKNIADIGAGFSDFISQLRGYVGNESNLFCIDPVYDDKYLEGSLSKTRKYFKRDIKDKVNLKNIISKNKDCTIDILERYNKNKIKSRKAAKWEKLDGINYKLKLEESDSIDVAIVTNLFYNIPSPVIFIEGILEKLNNNGELIIIDYSECSNNYGYDLLDELEKKNIVKSIINKNHRVYRIKREDFLEKIEDIRKISEYLQISEESDDKGNIDALIANFLEDIFNLLQESTEKYTKLILTIGDLENKEFPENISENLKLEIVKALDLGHLRNAIKNGGDITFEIIDGELSWEY